MKKVLAVLMFVSLFIAGCGGTSPHFSVENTPSYVDGEETEIIVHADEDGEAVSGITLKGSLEMARMDHGVIETVFTDNGDGTYTALVELPMSGEWIITLDAEHDGSTYEETITFDVNEG